MSESRPRLLERQSGGWLAVSDSKDPFRIGVFGESRDAAQANFARARDAWRKLAERAQAREPALPST
jgi:hypothetical protein